MKKVISVLLIIVGCSTPDYSGYAIITHVSKNNKNCWYRVEVYESGGYIPDSFNEVCNKFQIGDTVYLTKRRINGGKN